MPSRQVMFLLLSGQNLGNHLIRSALPMIIPFIAADLNLTGSQSASLLAAFFPGYVITQIPGGWAAQVFGAKIVAVANLMGNGLLLMAAPLAAATSNPVPALAACFAACGLFQGPLVPGQGTMKYPWLPKGVAKAWALRVISLGTRIGRVMAASTTPWLCSKYGWRFVPYVYGAGTAIFGIIFQLLAVR
jgi:MFS family permease